MLKSPKSNEKSKNNSFDDSISFDDIQNTSNFQLKMDIFTHYPDKELQDNNNNSSQKKSDIYSTILCFPFNLESCKLVYMENKSIPELNINDLKIIHGNLDNLNYSLPLIKMSFFLTDKLTTLKLEDYLPQINKLTQNLGVEFISINKNNLYIQCLTEHITNDIFNNLNNGITLLNFVYDEDGSIAPLDEDEEALRNLQTDFEKEQFFNESNNLINKINETNKENKENKENSKYNKYNKFDLPIFNDTKFDAQITNDDIEINKNIFNNNEKRNSLEIKNKNKFNNTSTQSQTNSPTSSSSKDYSTNSINQTKLEQIVKNNKYKEYVPKLLTEKEENKGVDFITNSTRDYQYKYVSRYIIQIENEKKFQVTRMIIGKNGSLLRNIIINNCIKYGDNSTKIRLRGKGSGHKEGLKNVESEDPMELCVSSLNYLSFLRVCNAIEVMLLKVYYKYYIYQCKAVKKKKNELKNKGKSIQELTDNIMMKKILKYQYTVNRFNTLVKEEVKRRKNQENKVQNDM